MSTRLHSRFAPMSADVRTCRRILSTKRITMVPAGGSAILNRKHVTHKKKHQLQILAQRKKASRATKYRAPRLCWRCAGCNVTHR